MTKRKTLSVLAVSAAAAAVLGGAPAVVIAAMAGPAAGASDAFGSLTPALTARLSQDANNPVIVVLKSQLSQAAVGTSAEGARSALVSASQSPLLSELGQVHASGVRQFTLIDSVAATVSSAEEQRLAANPAVARVIPDATVTLPASSFGSPAASTAASAATQDRTTAAPVHNVPGACAPKGKSYLAPEGLALTSTVSQTSKQPTARKLGITGAGVKVAFIADGLDTKNVNFIAKNGKSVFVDYQDFTGDGPSAPTDGGEAFLDANTIAGQGTHVYNLNGFAKQTYPGTCDITIQGVAPGASLVGLDIFSGEASHDFVTTNSMIAEAIDYAVTHDHVNVINESFGGNPLPDTTQDVTKLFNDAAAKAGVLVSVSSGDAGTSSTIGSPATDPSVISVGASTQFQMYAESNQGEARNFAPNGWVSDNISALSSSGFDEAGATVDIVAPGDLSWASCSTDLAKYSECESYLGKSTPIETAGGTSEASPFVAGAAALVIQAYRNTHDGITPKPALIKQILLSTATDLSIPAQEQGVGLLNSYKAVQLAESVGLSHRTGSTLLSSAGQLNDTGLPGSSKSWTVTLTNTGSKTQAVKVHGRTLGQDQNVQAGTVTLSDAASDQLTDFAGFKNNYEIFHFKVPAGQSRLDVSIAYAADPDKVAQGPQLSLIDPKGRFAANSLPQGVGNFGNVDVRTPAAGTWTAVVDDLVTADQGYNGPVEWRAATEQYASFGTVSPSSFSIAPGGSKKVTLAAKAPSTAGDMAGSIAINSNLGGLTSIPVTMRTLVNVAAGGAFSGVLTGGNGRMGEGQNDFYSFSVPAGTKAITANLALANDPPGGSAGVGIGAYLVSPDGNVLGYGQNIAIDTTLSSTNPTLSVSVLHPDKGRWTLIVDFAEPVPGTEVSDPFTGKVSFAAAANETGALPSGTTLAPGVATTVPVTITNTGNAVEDYFFDPRLATTTSMKLAPLTSSSSAGSNTIGLPMSATESFPEYFVPTQSRSIAVKQTSTVPAIAEISTEVGDPDAASTGLRTSSSLCGKSESASYAASGSDLTTGLWGPAATECGPFKSLTKSGKATEAVTVTTQGFDSSVMPATGDIMQLAQKASASAAFAPVELAPGATATVNVVIKPPASAKKGTKVTGTLYLDDFESGMPPFYTLYYGDEVAALTYSYTVG
jgi:hypothetical protein